MSTILANDANAQYSPYTWDVTASRARTINSGAYLRIAFTGDVAGLAATFDLTGLTSPYAVIDWRLDDGPWTVTRLAASVPLTPPASSKWGKHFLEIRVQALGAGTARWTTASNGVNFTGLTATGTITTFAMPTRARRIFAIGDSLAQGVLANGSPETLPSAVNNAVMGWAYPLGALLGAEMGVCGFGGVGITTAGDDAVPKFGTIWSQLWDGKARDFTQAPDLIVTVPGTNDGAGGGTVTTETTTWLNAMLAATPSTTKIALVENWKGIASAGIQAGIAGCTNPGRVTWVDTTGWWSDTDAPDAYHPWGYSNLTNLAPRLANSLEVISAGQRIWNGTAWVLVS